MKYIDSGVDIDSGNNFVDEIKPIIKNTFSKNVISDIGGFCGLYENPSLKNQLFVSSTDGVGTKLFLAFKLKEYEYLNTIGEDLVSMNVNDIITCGAIPLFFLDYLAISNIKNNIHYMKQIISSIANGCNIANCSFIAGETAELPVIYDEDKLDLAGFTVGIVNSYDLYGEHLVKDDDDIIGVFSSGPHSNGFSIISKLDIFNNHKDNETFIRWLMSPTINYTPLVRSLKDVFHKDIHAMAHITGEGLIANTNRVIQKNQKLCINWDSWNKHTFFDLLQEKLAMNNTEFRRVFNCGIGYVIIVDKNKSSSIIDFINNSLFFNSRMIDYKCTKIGIVEKK
jgi:phosphoribosylformylglycinamidine cyclo-ligase